MNKEYKPLPKTDMPEFQTLAKEMIRSMKVDFAQELLNAGTIDPATHARMIAHIEEEPSEKIPTYIFAGNYREYETYRMTIDKEARYVNSVQDLRGVRKYRLLKIGTWYMRPDRHEIDHQYNYRQETEGWERR